MKMGENDDASLVKTTEPRVNETILVNKEFKFINPRTSI